MDLSEENELSQNLMVEKREGADLGWIALSLVLFLPIFNWI